MVKDGLPGITTFDQTSNRVQYHTNGSQTNFVYDEAGNVVQGLAADGTLQWYKYDSANRLIEVRATNATGAIQASYQYGATNQRLWSQEGSAQTYYAWDGGMTLAEYTTFGANGLQWTKSFVYAGGRLLATESGSGTYQYHHPDRLGTRLITNSSGGVISEQIHLPYGTALTAESVSYGTTANPSKKRFTSYERSDSTKLDHAVNRQYNSGLGRFTQVDPIEMNSVDIGDPQSLNLYTYCGNDPINHTDPDGLFFKKLFRAIKKFFSNIWVRIAVLVALVVLSAGLLGPLTATTSGGTISIGGGATITLTGSTYLTGLGWLTAGLATLSGLTAPLGGFGGFLTPGTFESEVIPGGKKGTGGGRRSGRPSARQTFNPWLKIWGDNILGPRNREPRSRARYSPRFDNLTDHAYRHWIGGSRLRPRDYYNSAVQHTREHHRRFTYTHDNQKKFGYVTRLDGDNFLFTGTSTDGRVIFTHFVTNGGYLRRIGIPVVSYSPDFVGPIPAGTP
jgi:RHS repeat-associated protein